MFHLKRVLITGANSYVGTNVEKWLMREPDKYYVETLDMKDPNWVNFDFSKFDVVFHVAGIVHKKETRKYRSLFFKINRDLTIETARKAKRSGVSQFIFISTMSVYGLVNGRIDNTTILKPKTYYGKSKLEAENLLNNLADKSFNVSIIRPPMIYGPNCKGNYFRLSKFVDKFIIFPNIINRRSILYIDNFSVFTQNIIDNNIHGILYPQNSTYGCTTEIVKHMADIRHKKIIFTRVFNPIINIFKFNFIKKIFGDLYYDFSLSNVGFDYNIVNFSDSISRSENIVEVKK